MDENISTDATITDQPDTTGDAPVVEESSESQTLSPSETLVTLSDGTQVLLSELENGILRQEDYTKKTQELAEQRRALEQQALLLQKQHQDTPFNNPVIEGLVQLDPESFEYDSERKLASAISQQQQFMVGALRELLDLVQPVITTSQQSQAMNEEIASVSQILGRAVDASEIQQAKQATGQSDARVAMLMLQRAKPPVTKPPVTANGDSTVLKRPDQEGFTALDAVRLADQHIRR